MKILVSLFLILLFAVVAMADEFTRNPDLFDYVTAENRDLGIHGEADPTKWTGADKLLEGLYLGLWLADYNQTRQISRQPDKYNELNPILGPQPSKGRVNAYFAANAVLHPAFMNLWPSSVRKFFQAASIGYQANSVKNNADLGLDIVRW